MNTPRLKIFSIVFGVLYLAAFYFDLALFRFYPAVTEFHWMRTDGIGAVILWYGWIVTAALASSAIAFAVPKTFAERLWPGWTWIVPTAVVIVMLIYERRWFV